MGRPHEKNDHSKFHYLTSLIVWNPRISLQISETNGIVYYYVPEYVIEFLCHELHHDRVAAIKNRTPCCLEKSFHLGSRHRVGWEHNMY